VLWAASDAVRNLIYYLITLTGLINQVATWGSPLLKLSKSKTKKNLGMTAEAELLKRAIPKGAKLCTLDERGQLISSPDFANQLGRWRDTGTSDLAIIIGGADGIDPNLRAQADFSISFGKMVWPHMLARVMLCEQIYRASTILAGSPYHRT